MVKEEYLYFSSREEAPYQKSRKLSLSSSLLVCLNDLSKQYLPTTLFDSPEDREIYKRIDIYEE